MRGRKSPRIAYGVGYVGERKEVTVQPDHGLKSKEREYVDGSGKEGSIL